MSGRRRRSMELSRQSNVFRLYSAERHTNLVSCRQASWQSRRLATSGMTRSSNPRNSLPGCRSKAQAWSLQASTLPSQVQNELLGRCDSDERNITSETKLFEIGNSFTHGELLRSALAISIQFETATLLMGNYCRKWQPY